MVELGWVLSQCGQRRCNVEYCVLVLLGAIMNHELMAAMRRCGRCWRNFEKSERLLLLQLDISRERGRKEKGKRVQSSLDLDDFWMTEYTRTQNSTITYLSLLIKQEVLNHNTQQPAVLLKRKLKLSSIKSTCYQ